MGERVNYVRIRGSLHSIKSSAFSTPRYRVSLCKLQKHLKKLRNKKEHFGKRRSKGNENPTHPPQLWHCFGDEFFSLFGQYSVDGFDVCNHARQAIPQRNLLYNLKPANIHQIKEIKKK